MNSDTDIIQVNKTGTMDDTEIRQEICDVMEGTKDAFEMRAKNIILIFQNRVENHSNKLYNNLVATVWQRPFSRSE